MISRIVWMCVNDTSITVATSSEAKDLAALHPDDPKYRAWTEVLVFEDAQP